MRPRKNRDSGKQHAAPLMGLDERFKKAGLLDEESDRAERIVFQGRSLTQVFSLLLLGLIGWWGSGRRLSRTSARWSRCRRRTFS